MALEPYDATSNAKEKGKGKGSDTKKIDETSFIKPIRVEGFNRAYQHVPDGFAMVVEKPFGKGVNVYVGPCNVSFFSNKSGDPGKKELKNEILNINFDIARKTDEANRTSDPDEKNRLIDEVNQLKTGLSALEYCLRNKQYSKQLGLAFAFSGMRSLVPLSDQPIEIVPKSTIADIGGIQVGVPVLANFRVARDEDSIKKFYHQKDAIGVLKNKIAGILSKIVAGCTYKQLKNMRVCFTDFSKSSGIPASIIDEVKKDVINLNSEMQAYGVELEDINITDVNLPPDLASAKAKEEASLIDNARRLKEAETNTEIAKQQLEQEKLMNQRLSDRIKQMREAGMSAQQITEIMKLEYAAPGVTYVAGSSPVTPTIMTHPSEGHARTASKG